MTDQATFDKIVRHLLRQNKRSRMPDGNICLYRGPNGLKCAIGCLISDKEYRHEFEGARVAMLLTSYNCKQLMGLNIRLLTAMQRLHDECEVELWPTYIKHIAKQYGLKIPKIKG